MSRGRRRKIEVPTDTLPQFELGDTAEDIERRRREREELCFLKQAVHVIDQYVKGQKEKD